MFDIVIAGGTVVDGTGGPSTRLDVGIEGDRITAVGDLSVADRRRTIDATDHVVTPGFIDIHTHSDLPLLIDPRGLSKLRQGVTTDVPGNCGITPFPSVAERAHLLRESFANGDLVDWSWHDLAGYRATLERQGIGINVAPLVGHSAIRGAGLGFEDRTATPDELAAMKRLLATAMDQGAFGFSTGLTLPPSAYGDTEEIVALAGVMAGYPGRFYTSHLRVWSGQHATAVAEAIDIGRRAGVPVQVSHMAVNEPKFWGQADRVIEVCQHAVDAGHDVTFDVYPYAASSSGFSQCMPTWAQSGGTKAMVARLRDPSTRAEIRADMAANGLFRGWPWMWDRLLICSARSAEAAPFEGMTIQQAADVLGRDPLDTALDLMDWDEGRIGVIFFYRTEEDMRTFLRHPLGMMGSDGSALAADGPLSGGKPHPRNYGAHARVLGRYVRDERVLTMEQAVHKLSGMVADRLGLRDRGRIAPGMAADVAVVDPATVEDRADFVDPHQYASGVPWVIVNGVVAVELERETGALAGRVLEPAA